MCKPGRGEKTGRKVLGLWTDRPMWTVGQGYGMSLKFHGKAMSQRASQDLADTAFIHAAVSNCEGVGSVESTMLPNHRGRGLLSPIFPGVL